MLAVFKGEIYKLLRLRKTYVAILGINAVGMFTLCALGIIWLKKPEVFAKLADIASANAASARKILLWYHLFLTWFFSLFTLFFMSLIIGEVVGKELGSGTAKCSFLMPVKRHAVYAGKFAAVLAVYGVAFLFDMLLRCAAFAILVYNQRILWGVVSWRPLALIVGIYVILDLSHLAYVFLVSVMARNIEMTMVYAVVFYMMMSAFDLVLLGFSKLDLLGPTMTKVTAYTYTNTCAAVDVTKIWKYFRVDGLPFPVTTDLLGANVIYTLAFLGLGCWLYCRKEDRPEP